MPSVNLIPAEVLEQRARRERCRLWALAALLAWSLVLIPVIREYQAANQLLSQREQMDQIRRRLDVSRRQTDEAAARLAGLDDDLELARRLRDKRPWSGLLAAMTAVQPHGVWLAALTTVRVLNTEASAEARPEGSPADRSKLPAQTPGRLGPRKIIVQGQARKLEDLIAFETALRELGLFKDVHRGGVGDARVQEVKIMGFSLECSW
jgi:Tfp pilus assembly protein PilN